MSDRNRTLPGSRESGDKARRFAGLQSHSLSTLPSQQYHTNV